MVIVTATSPCVDCHPSHSERISPRNRRSFFAGRLPAISPRNCNATQAVLNGVWGGGFVEMDGLAAVLAAAGVAPLAVDADSFAATVPAVVPLTSVNTDLRTTALLALGANPLVHADAAAAAVLAPGANPLVHADAAAAALLRTREA